MTQAKAAALARAELAGREAARQAPPMSEEQVWAIIRLLSPFLPRDLLTKGGAPRRG